MNVHENEGFTLIEVLVAFAILASAIIIGFQIHEDGLRRLASGENKNRILAVSKFELAKLNAAPLASLDPHAGVTDGVSWKIVITPSKSDTISQLNYATAKIYASIGAELKDQAPVLETIVFVQGSAR
jgi:prepilin-type N-terminal cleavage/methylation domain-containing protein